MSDCEEEEDLISEFSESVASTVESTESELKRTVTLVPSVSTKSWVWKFCAKYPETIENSQDIAVCTICREMYKNNSKAKSKIWEIKIGSSSSTSKITNHFHSKHKEEYIKYTTKKDDCNQGPMNSYVRIGKRL